jgi:hypothetical protein
MRGTTVLLLLLAGQGSGEERGRFRLSYFGREAGVEEYRLESFEDGHVVLFSKTRYEIEVQGRKQAFFADTVLTMDASFAPRLYAAYHKSGPDLREVKIEWKRGKAHVEGRKPVDSAARFLLDSNVYAQLLPILRRHEPGPRKGRVFSPALGGDLEFTVADRGEDEVKGRDGPVRARKLEVTLGALVVTAHVDEKKRILRAVSPLTGALVELEGFEGSEPAPRRADSVEEAEVSFRSGGLALAGAVTRPRGARACPAVLILTDAGPHDRDGAPGKGEGRFFGEPLRAPLYRALAYALSEAGLLVLRVDDRGCGKSEGDFGAARFSDLEADAAAALAYLGSRDDVLDVALAGHGEGGLVAALLADRHEKVRAAFLLAAPGRPLDALLLDSLERALRSRGTREEVLAVLLEKERRLFEEIRRAPGDALEIDERSTFVGWLKERFRLDPAAALSRVKARVVLAHGGKDASVPPEESERLRQARPDAEFRRFEPLDHAFCRPDGQVDPEFLRWLAEEVLKERK